jgi:hypothetical protein
MGNDNYVAVGDKLWFSGTCGRARCFDDGAMGHIFKFSVKITWQNSITDPNSVCELTDCSATVFVNEFSNVFNIFCRFAGAWSL